MSYEPTTYCRVCGDAFDVYRAPDERVCEACAPPKIITNHVYPPLPTREMDWSAIDDDTYDGAPDARSPIGWGKSEADAIADLRDQMEDES